jgi:hypothetical protein
VILIGTIVQAPEFTVRRKSGEHHIRQHSEREGTVMVIRYTFVCSAILGLITLQATSAHALSTHECSTKYQAAKSAGTLNGMKWNEFRKSQCGAEATAAPAPTPAAAPAPLTNPTRSATPVAIGNAVFPRAIDPKYSNESAGKARRETCLEQYNVNKANNANGGLKWIQRGGGYYSECNRRLKGQA